MRTHFQPYDDDDDPAERGWCGTLLGERGYTSSDWRVIDCKKCLKNREKFQSQFDASERKICENLGQMADFMTIKGGR